MKKNLLNYILNGTIIVFLIGVAYFGFSLINNSLKSDKSIKEITDTTKSLTNQPNLSIQIDVQNGSGENGAASKITEYLRKNNLDVVDIGNYKSQDIERTLIIDRSGDNVKARKVAMILGVSEKSIIQQLNNSLYLDVTVVIGKDFKELKPFMLKKN
ncbi:MAG TPA: LytR C-terminal domain-containing protein [Ignavibacteria bacterium]|nr:LytR C-terminal domain-containing protein [Ignavibacteria bacterium]